MPKKFDREPVAWITRGGKHVPIFEGEDEEEKIYTIDVNGLQRKIKATSFEDAKNKISITDKGRLEKARKRWNMFEGRDKQQPYIKLVRVEKIKKN